MPLWTSVEDVTSRWVGSGAPTDDTLVTALIDDAEAVILAAFPRIQERIDADTLNQSVVTMVTARMVSRILRNPEGLSYWQQNTGPFGQGRNFGSNTDIWMSADERAMLAPTTRGKAFEVDTAPDMYDPTFGLYVRRDLEEERLWERVDD